ncbi:hypothetical protein BCR37DRAFT_377349 [Protomyces lactucae-debilis]|uniref:Pentatricopeptide repeat protein n=1 Tax=Protomyces lactucae-debilis TaxID=2754530 RepID=A0A1Y2FNT0_PROLT|nr:uncharacterized protein BCR37DRAFT_377349 [Protomyces lactucae-debilis]ORY85651.1 hypothetical protein BCR37DRAFT_377349 [Protomyces lactucae-debilis]
MIKPLLRCSSGTRPLFRNQPPDKHFFGRFYSVMRAMQRPSPVLPSKDSKRQNKGLVRHATTSRETPSDAEVGGKDRIHRPSLFERHVARIADSMLSIDFNQRKSKNQLDQLYRQRGSWRRRLRDSGDAILQERLRTLEEAIRLLRQALLKPSVRDASGFSQVPDYSLDSIVAKRLDNDVLDLLREPAVRQLQDLARLLSDSSTPPSVKTFNIMISRLTRLRQNTAAWTVFQAMLRLGYRPDEYTVASVLNLCIVTGDYVDFRKVLAAVRLQQAASHRKRRGLLFFSTAIKGLTKFGHLRHAETYFNLMVWEGVKPTSVVLTAMLQGFAARGAWERGRPYFERLVRMPWDRLTVVTLLRHCAACKQPVAASRIRAMAAKKGVVLGHGEEDLAQLPIGWKTKGLDVPDSMKLPGRNDIGMLRKQRFTRAKEREPVAIEKPWRQWHNGKWEKHKASS